MGDSFYLIACHVLWREISYYASKSKNNFDFKYLKQGLHNTPDILKRDLQEAIDEVDGEYPVILVGYGLCSNGISGITAKKSKLVIMRGHDCITFFLGSKERYREYFDNNPGTYWYTPGWIETSTQPGKDRYEGLLAEYTKKYGEDNAEYLMEMEQGWFKEYKKAAYVDLGFCDSEEYKNYTRECASYLNWKYDELTGDGSLFFDFINGNWDDSRFLVVEPGTRVEPSNNETIIKAL